MGSEVQHRFLQSMMSHGAMTEEDTRKLYRQCVEKVGGEDSLDFAPFVTMVNKQLKPLGFELSCAVLEAGDERWYAMVNRSPDAAALVGSSFPPQELEFFNKVVKLVVQSGGVVPSGQLLSLTISMDKKLSHGAAQEFLKARVKDHWLAENEGLFTAGPRFILELRPFISDICGEEVPLCKMCNEPVIQGQHCEECDVSIHLLCVAKLARGRSAIHCPGRGCRVNWPHDIPDIELSSGPSPSTSTASDLPDPSTSNRREKRGAAEKPAKRTHSRR